MGRMSASASADVPHFFDIRILSADVLQMSIFSITIKYYNIFFPSFIKMSFTKRQYDYSQTFNYKQITEKTAQNTPILRYI